MTTKRNLRFKRNIHRFLALSSMALAGAASAAGTAPEIEVRKTAGTALAAIAETSSPRALRRIAEQEIAPQIDFHRLTAQAAGKLWELATEEQRDQLALEFRRLLLRTYAEDLALANHADTRLFVEPVRDPADDEAVIRTHVVEPGHRRTTIDYRLTQEDGSWKVVEVTVDDRSLAQRYRPWLIAAARTGGIDGVIRTLSALNRLDGA